VMKDHWHALVGIPPNRHLSDTMSNLNEWISRKTNTLIVAHQCVWQDGFYDTRIRSTKQFRYVCSYIEFNPVNAGYVSVPDGWEWSSANSRFEKSLLRPWPWKFETDCNEGYRSPSTGRLPR
jgi:REP element-mobilizing transposase RayT